MANLFNKDLRSNPFDKGLMSNLSSISLRSNPFNYFDAIYCINLYSRPDRYNHALSLFNSLDIPVIFYQTHKHPTDGVQGCFESHIGVVTDAYNKGYNNALIFEDDIITTLSKDQVYNKVGQCISFMQTNPYDIFFLGALHDIVHTSLTRVEGYPDIYHTSGICAHSYVLSRTGMTKYANTKYTGVPIDIVYSYNKDAYGIYPSIFYQNNMTSDTSLASFRTFDLKLYLWKLHELYGVWIGIPLNKFMCGMGVLVMILFLTNKAKILAYVLLVLIIVYLCCT